jgi:uncharacterized protein YbjT (DUF2867 family)
MKPVILVTGATGNQGGAVAHHLLQHGFDVSALVRDKTKPATLALKQAGATVVEGDLDDRASLDRAVQGVDGVFSVQGSLEGSEVEIRQGTALADAALAANIKHFVYSSVGSAERKTGIPHFESKFQIEEHIRAIGLPHTILRPVAFLYNYNWLRPMIESGQIFQPLSPDRNLQQLSEEDYGEMVAQVFERPEDFLGRAIEAASVDLKMTEVAATFSDVIGRAVTYQQIPFEAYQEKAGLELTTMMRWFESMGYNADLAQLEREFGALTSLDSYLRAHEWAPASNAAPVTA